MSGITLTPLQLSRIAAAVAEQVAPLVVQQVLCELRGEKPLLSTAQKAKELGIKPGTLRKWVREGKVNAIKHGNEKQGKLYFR